MDRFQEVHEQVIAALHKLAEEQGWELEGAPLSAVVVESPRDPSHGDMATNAAMVLAKPLRVKPRDIAELLKIKLEAFADVTSVEVAGPGFINLRFDPAFWQAVIPAVLEEKIGFGNGKPNHNQKINVEYVSVNPTGPMHVGHARGAVFGDAMAGLLLKAGYNVTKEYYINDAGAQVDVLARSAYLRYREALGEKIGEIPEGLYPGEYLKAVGEALAKEHDRALLNQDEEEWLPLVRRFAIDAMMALIKDDLAALGIHHDVFRSEADVVAEGAVEECLQELEDRGLIYTGVLEPPKGMKPDDWEPRPQTLFRSTEFGDDVDRALKKSDGSWTYFASDIAYHRDKFRRGHTELINVWGADHGGYVKRMQSAVKAITQGEAKLDVKLCQLVNLLDNGQPVKMSKRAGTFVTLRDMVDEVGKDVVRFIMLTRKNDAPLDFDFTKVTEQSKDNPVFYVQYAHARAKSVLRGALEEMPDALKASHKPDMSILAELKDPAEIALIHRMASWPGMVASAAQAHEPHRIAFYLHDLAAEFHALWTKGKENVDLRFIVHNNATVTMARLALIQAVAWVIASGLQVFGVEPVESM